MSKPLIAVTPLFNDRLNSIWMLPDYTNSIARAGGIPVILPLYLEKEDLMQLTTQFDGFLFTGGQDVNPSLYGEEKMSYCEAINSDRDTTELILLKAVLEQNKPVFGICRGMQFMNVALGGTLYQDIDTQYQSAVKLVHRQPDEYATPIHNVTVLDHTPLSAIVGTSLLQVNSLHHQAVKDLSPLLRVNAVSEDGLIEALHMPDKRFALAVQWHPEFLAARDPMAEKLFAAFVKSCK